MSKLTKHQALLKARSHAQKGEAQEAKKLYELVLRAFPENKTAQQGLASLSIQKQANATQGPPSETLRRLFELYNQGKLSDVIEEAQKLIKQYPNTFIIWSLLGAANMGLDRILEALTCFKKTTELNPNYVDGFVGLGVTLKKSGKPDEALGAYEKAISLEPDHGDIYYNMGNALNDLDRLDEALGAYKKAIALKPDHPSAYVNMGGVLKDLGKPDEAVGAYKRAIALKPDNADIYYNMGNALNDLGQREEAVEAYNKALSREPDHGKAARNLIKMPVGSLNKKSLDLCEKTLLEFPGRLGSESQVEFFQANLLMHQGDLSAAFCKFRVANNRKISELGGLSGNFADQYENNFNRIRKWLPAPANFSKAGIKKIFILGPSSSGKSLLEQTLCRSQKVQPLYEKINLKYFDWINSNAEKEVEFGNLFRHSEEALGRQGYEIITSTNPHTLFYIDFIIDRVPNSLFIFVSRDDLDIASEMFIREYRSGNYYSYDPNQIMKYLELYNEIANMVTEKVPEKTFRVSFERIKGQPSAIVDEVGRFVSTELNIEPASNQNWNFSSKSLFRDYFENMLKN